MTAIPLTLADYANELVITTIPKWIRQVENQMLRASYFFDRILKAGRVIKGESGPELIWDLKIRLPEVTPWTNHADISFEPTNKHIQMRTGWRGYKCTEAMSMMDQEINKGDQAIVRLIQDKSNDLKAAMNQNLQGECYKSGSSAGRTDRYHGLETGLGAGTVTVADKIAAPSGTYANVSTVLAAQGGTWSDTLGTPNNASLSNDWPDGSGDPDYDCNTPKLVNTGATAWDTGSNAHEDNLFRAISQTQAWLTTLGGADGKPDLCVMDGWSFQRMRENTEAKMRLQAPVPSSTDIGLVGADGRVYLDGLEIRPDFWCPITTAYMFNMSQVSIHSLFSEGLLRSKGPVELAEKAFSSVWALFTLGNIRYRSMKHFAKLYPYATS
jgi:hypothetical protein